MKRLIVALLVCFSVACTSPVISSGDNNAPVLNIRNSIAIPPLKVDGVKITELSGLAWDQDEQLLYAISDKGRVYHFRLQLEDNRLVAAEPVFAAHLLDVKGERVRKNRRDSEGLTVLHADNGKAGDTELVISFEGEPRIIRFTPQGRAIKNIAVPKPLRKKSDLQHGNDGLEAVTLHPRFGFITAPETPLKGQPRNLHTVYSTKGRQWSFMAYPAKNSAISALEALPDGNLLVMERAWSGVSNPLVVSLRYLDFSRCSRDGACHAQNMKVISTQWLVDNFEGLTHIQGNQYLMVSDDGDEDLLRTSLTLFTLDLE